jgi:hypothetical protein
MKCREFEDNLSQYFSNCDFQTRANASATDNWSGFVPADARHEELLEHVSGCSDCANGLLWYLDIEGTVNYQEYPCLHLAYYCNNEEHRCVERIHDIYSIILEKEVGTGIVIGFCPWCGIKLNTALA